ncbi:MAG: isochorismatase family protein [Chloroflexota bacterium]|nr:MAG: isochorismatase family protein [Chloroflexota bacterium]
MQLHDPRSALIVVDMQNDFADPGGSLSVAGGADTIPVVNTAAWAAIRAGAFVVYTQDWHPEHTPHFAQDGGIWPVHCVGDAWGSAFHPDLEVVGPSVHKGANGEDGYSGFTMRDAATSAEIPTELDALFRIRSIERVIVCGLATDYCVKATALDAIRLGYATSVLLDGIAPVDLAPGDGDRALEEMRAAGARLVFADGSSPS